MNRVLFLVTLVSLALTGCGGDDKPTTPAPAGEASKMFDKGTGPKGPVQKGAVPKGAQ